MIFLCMRPANESRRYNVTSSLIGWAFAQNDSWRHFGVKSQANPRSFVIWVVPSLWSLIDVSTALLQTSPILLLRDFPRSYNRKSYAILKLGSYYCHGPCDNIMRPYAKRPSLIVSDIMAWISNTIPSFAMGCNYQSIPKLHRRFGQNCHWIFYMSE